MGRSWAQHVAARRSEPGSARGTARASPNCSCQYGTYPAPRLKAQKEIFGLHESQLQKLRKQNGSQKQLQKFQVSNLLKFECN